MKAGNSRKSAQPPDTRIDPNRGRKEDGVKVTIYTDGSARGNPGNGGYGAVLSFTNSQGQTFTRELSEGMRILVLTIVISAAAAILFPHKEDDLVA